MVYSRYIQRGLFASVYILSLGKRRKEVLVLEMELVCFTVFSLTNGYTTHSLFRGTKFTTLTGRSKNFSFADCRIDSHWFGSHSCKYKLRKIGFVFTVA